MANRLVNATSPYLLQHADNPVEWWEWGDDAFAEAGQRGVPVFLSVGYAACHWCHEVHRWWLSTEICETAGQRPSRGSRRIGGCRHWTSIPGLRASLSCITSAPSLATQWQSISTC